MHSESLNLHTVVVFLVAAGIVVPLLGRLRISPVLGFLAVGLVIGPYGLARFTDSAPWLSALVIKEVEGVRALAELGVVFLLFMIGLELSRQRLWAMRTAVFGLGTAQVLVTAAVIAIIATFFGNSPAAAMVLGAAFALSSTAIVMELLIESRRVGSPTGQTVFPVLLFQDLAVLPIVLMVTALGANTGGSPLLAFASSILWAAVAVIVIMALGRLFLRPLFRLIGSGANREMFIAAVLLVIIGTSVATAQTGLSMALGAFLAGLLFAETEYRHEIEADIEPFKGLLLGLFFISVGMGIDPAEIARKPVWLAASVIGLFAIKGAIVFVLARLFARPTSVAAESALLLGQGGEFAFVIVAMANALGLIPSADAQFMLIVASLTMIATPLVARYARWLALRLERSAPASEDLVPAEQCGHVVIVGYGRVGRMLGSVLDAQGIAHVAIDNDPELVRPLHAQGACIHFGDARQPQILRRLGMERAAALVVTMNQPDANERVTSAARKMFPELAIYARARDATQATRLFESGASHVVPETIEASLQLSELVLIACGMPDEAASRLVETRRQHEQATLDNNRHG
ncbi:MAG: hypothetical protein RLZ98_53 [Pseudomonadota bacterium]|jgi:CPA2 family monovalent cation:H+ antiporter-2